MHGAKIMFLIFDDVLNLRKFSILSVVNGTLHQSLKRRKKHNLQLDDYTVD